MLQRVGVADDKPSSGDGEHHAIQQRPSQYFRGYDGFSEQEGGNESNYSERHGEREHGPEVAIGRENRVLFIQRTWCRMEL